MRSKGEWPDGSAHFLRRLWRNHKGRGFVFVGARNIRSGKWRDYPLPLPVTRCGLLTLLESIDPSRHDLYFCPNAFRDARRLKENALPTPFAWSDIDKGNYNKCRPHPNLVIRTSPGRYQALWLWDYSEPVSRAENLSIRLTDDANADPNGWSITKYLRVPGTFNLKPAYDSPCVEIIQEDWVPRATRPTEGSRFLRRSLADIEDEGAEVLLPPKPILDRYIRRLHPRVRYLLRTKKVSEPDRSKCVFEIVADLHKVGATRLEIMAVLRDNVYFRDKHGSSRGALHREVSRIVNKLGRTT